MKMCCWQALSSQLVRFLKELSSSFEDTLLLQGPQYVGDLTIDLLDLLTLRSFFQADAFPPSFERANIVALVKKLQILMGDVYWRVRVSLCKGLMAFGNQSISIASPRPKGYLHEVIAKIHGLITGLKNLGRIGQNKVPHSICQTSWNTSQSLPFEDALILPSRRPPAPTRME